MSKGEDGSMGSTTGHMKMVANDPVSIPSTVYFSIKNHVTHFIFSRVKLCDYHLKHQ